MGPVCYMHVGCMKVNRKRFAPEKYYWLSCNTFQWMIVAGGLNALEEVLSSAEILQHSNGAFQVKHFHDKFMICSALEVDHPTSLHPVADKGEQSQWILPPLRRPVWLQLQLQRLQRDPEVGPRQPGVEVGGSHGHQEEHPRCHCCITRSLFQVLHWLDYMLNIEQYWEFWHIAERQFDISKRTMIGI